MHSLQYKGRYTKMRHGQIRNTFAAIMREVCFDVEIEPKFWPLERESFVHKTTSTEDEARLDNKANGLWDSRFCRIFFNVMFFTTVAESCAKEINEAHKGNRTFRQRRFGKEKLETFLQIFHADTSRIILVPYYLCFVFSFLQTG